jgi:hypothetical protein
VSWDKLETEEDEGRGIYILLRGLQRLIKTHCANPIPQPLQLKCKLPSR